MTQYSQDNDNEGSNAPRNTLQRWVDPAMFKAEPIDPEAGPRVSLLWMTPDPLGAAAAMNAIYVGKVKYSLADVTRAEREALLPDMAATVLTAPAEAIKLHFLIEGVTRAFTHQMVRQRTAVFAQESMRFAVVGDGAPIPVQVPPSLAVGRPHREMIGGILNDHPGISSSMARDMVESLANPTDRARWAWDKVQADITDAYDYMVNSGIPAEDARGLLPTNVLTRLHYVTDLRNLQATMGKRLSTQAQFEWKAVIAAMARAIREYDPLKAVRDSIRGRDMDDEEEAFLYRVSESDRWQYEAISDLFRPICYSTGKCEFMASADRSCTIRSRVEANHEIGRPSSEWATDYEAPEMRDAIVTYGPLNTARTAEGKPAFIAAIHPVEWLADPTAAR